MKFTDLKKTLKNSLHNAYYIYGEDGFLRKNALNIILSHFNIQNKELNEILFFSENISIQKVLDACNTLPFFSDKKLVIIKENGGKIEDTFIKLMQEYLKNSLESTVLIFVASVKNELFKPLMKDCETVECSKLDFNLLCRWIDSEILKHNKQIKFEAKKLIIDSCNLDLMKISTELEKLIAFCGENQIITTNMVELLVVKDLEFQIYELTNAIGDKDKDKAILLAKNLIEDKNNIHLVMGLIFNYFRRMFHSIVGMGTNAELAKDLGVKEYAVKMAKQTGLKFGAIKLKKINEFCVNIDFKIKNGNLDLENGLYLLIFEILSI